MRAIFSNNSAVRDYAVAGVVIVTLAMVGLHSVKALVDSTRQSVRVETARFDKKDDKVKSYTVTRSVMDDNISTGSIKGRPIVLDPCTGQIKSQ